MHKIIFWDVTISNKNVIQNILELGSVEPFSFSDQIVQRTKQKIFKFEQNDLVDFWAEWVSSKI